MRHLLLTVLIMAAAFCCISCDDEVTRLLAKADSYVETHPDSALSTLETIDTAAFRNDGERALFYLLLNQSLYKLYKPTPQDSLLTFCVDYYAKKGDKRNLCRALYYKGVTLYERECESEALKTLKEGLHIAITEDEPLYISKYNETLFSLNLQIRNFKYALKYAKAFLESSWRIKNYDFIVRGHIHIAEVYDKLGMNDSVHYYIEQALPHYEHIDTQYKAELIANMGVVYQNEGFNDKAKMFLEKSLKIKKLDNALITLADIYIKEGNEDKAKKIWKDVSCSENVDLRISKLNSLADYYRQQQNYNVAYDLMNEINRLKDSISDFSENAKLSDVQSEYENAIIKKDYSNKVTILLFSLAVSILLTFFGIYTFIVRRKKWKHQIKEKDESEKQLLNQVDVLRKKHEDSENNLSSLKKKMKKVKNENSDKKVILKEEVEKVKQDFSNVLQQGKQVYDYLVEKKRLPIKENVEKTLIEYYAIAYPKIWETWNVKYKHLTQGQYVYLILCDMNFTQEEIKIILGVGDNAIRSIKSRLKANEREK